MDKLITVLKGFDGELSIMDAIALGISIAKTNTKNPVEKIMDQAITVFLFEVLDKEFDELLRLLIEKVGIQLNDDEIDNLLSERPDLMKARFSLIIISDFLNRVKVDKLVIPIWVSRIKIKYKDLFNEIIVREFRSYGYSLSIEQLS